MIATAASAQTVAKQKFSQFDFLISFLIVPGHLACTLKQCLKFDGKDYKAVNRDCEIGKKWDKGCNKCECVECK